MNVRQIHTIVTLMQTVIIGMDLLVVHAKMVILAMVSSV